MERFFYEALSLLPIHGEKVPEGRMSGSANIGRLALGYARVSGTYPSVSAKNVVSRFQ